MFFSCIENKDPILLLISQSKHSRKQIAPRPVLSCERKAGHQDENARLSETGRGFWLRPEYPYTDQQRPDFSNATNSSSAQCQLILRLNPLSTVCDFSTRISSLRQPSNNQETGKEGRKYGSIVKYLSTVTKAGLRAGLPLCARGSDNTAAGPRASTAPRPPPTSGNTCLSFPDAFSPSSTAFLHSSSRSRTHPCLSGYSVIS